MKYGVITFPGSNCDQDLIYALRHTLGQEVAHLFHKDTDLQGADFVLLPGGFSYGDYLRAGAIAQFSPVMAEVVKHAQAGGYVMGICNGFQILCEAGLLPGALLRNASTRFICDNVYIQPVSKNALPTHGLEERPYRVPIAHADGNYFCDPDTLKRLYDQDQILFKYVDATGRATPAANPNGSIDNIAGVCNAGRNVFAYMPHPERAADPLLPEQDGLPIMRALLHAQTVTS